jgi:hypothetical protein
VKHTRSALYSLVALAVASCSLINSPDELAPGESGSGAGGADGGAGGRTGPSAAGGDGGAAEGGASSSAGSAGTSSGSDGGMSGMGGDGAGGEGIGGAGGSSDMGPLTFPVFLREFTSLACRRVLHCEFKLGLGALLEILCHPSVGANLFSEVGFALEGAFNPARGQECLDALEVLDCSIYNSTFDPTCDILFEPFIELGEACNGEGQCIDGICDLEQDSCGGTCVTAAEVDEFCDSSDDCVGSAFCDFDANLCRAKGAQGAICEDTNGCRDLLWCHSVTGTCEPLPNVGEVCDLDLGGDPCRGSLVCTDTGYPDKICSIGGAADAACDFDHPCRPGFRCSDTTDTCVDLNGEGEACDSAENCPAGFECVADECTALPAVDDDCTPVFDCIQGVCDEGACRLLANDEACSGNGTGIFASCEGWCENDVCVDRKPDGSLCQDEWECLDGSLCLGEPGYATCIACE